MFAVGACLVMSACMGVRFLKKRVPGIVYVVDCVDTESNAFNYYRYSQSLNMNTFVPGYLIDQTFETAWRDSLTDSFGGHVKFTWFLMTIEGYRHTPQGINAIPGRFLEQFKDRVLSHGDEVAWHYHHADWCWDEQRQAKGWKLIRTFSDSVYCEKTDRRLAFDQMASFVYLNRVYPASFRSGWNWENTDFSNWLDSLIPFDYSNNWPDIDLSVIAYRPSRKNVFRRGSLSRQVVRCVDRPDTTHLRALFERASAGEDVIFAYYGHNYGGTNRKNNALKTGAAAVQHILADLSNRYGVAYRYCTASDAISQYVGSHCPDSFGLTVAKNCDENTVTVAVDTLVFGTPIVCWELYNGSISADFMTPDSGQHRWVYNFTHTNVMAFIVAGISRCGQSFLSEEMTPCR